MPFRSHCIPCTNSHLFDLIVISQTLSSCSRQQIMVGQLLMCPDRRARWLTHTHTHTYTLVTTRLNPACHVAHCCAPQDQCVPRPHETTRAHPCQACCMLHIACLVVAHFPLPCTNSHLLGPSVGTLLHLTGLVLHVVALGWRRALCVDETVVPFHTCCRCHTARRRLCVVSASQHV